MNTTFIYIILGIIIFLAVAIVLSLWVSFRKRPSEKQIAALEINVDVLRQIVTQTLEQSMFKNARIALLEKTVTELRAELADVRRQLQLSEAKQVSP